MPPEAEEAADFGDEAAPEPATQAPQRAMPDYGDVIEGDADEKVEASQKVEVKVKSEPGMEAVAAPKRKDAIYISGANRLTRTHIAEIFESKNLPEFIRVDWISDSEVLAVFATDEEAATSLKGAIEGFRDVEDDGAPGPGLWRAKRGMMDFRQATTADSCELGWKKVHRGGRQVREFRLFTAMSDMDKKILEHEQELKDQRKRPAQADDDAEDGQPKKKARVAKDPNSIDLLEKMASGDKKILVKQEEAGDLDPLPQIRADEEEEDYYARGLAKVAESLKNGTFAEEGRRKGKGKGKRKGKGKGKNQNWDSWGHEDRGDYWEDDDDWFEDRRGGKGGKRNNKRRYDDDEGESRPKRQRNDDFAGVLGEAVSATAEELEKRSARSKRFESSS